MTTIIVTIFVHNFLLGQLVVQGTVDCVACHTSDGESIIDWLHPADHDSCIRGRGVLSFCESLYV